MLTTRLRQRAPSARAVCIGNVNGYVLCWHKRSKDGSGKCDAVETGRPRDALWGVVVELTAVEKLHLDEKEGLGHGYRERVVTVVTDAGNVSAGMYYASAIEPGLRPYSWYRDLVIAGALEHGLPQQYIEALAAVEAIEGPDPKRAAKNRRLIEGKS